MREIIGVQQNSAQTELVADGNRRKPPISNVTNAIGDNKDSCSVLSDRSTGVRPLSTASSDGQTIIMDDIDDIDDDITTTASESYAQDDSSSNEGNILSSKCVYVFRACLNLLNIWLAAFVLSSLRRRNLPVF